MVKTDLGNKFSLSVIKSWTKSSLAFSSEAQIHILLLTVEYLVVLVNGNGGKCHPEDLSSGKRV